MEKIYYALIFFFISHTLHAASCCGGGQSAASLMIADHSQEWTFSTLLRSDIGQTNNNGQALMDDDQNKDHTFTSSLEYKKLISSRFQGNASLSFIQKESTRLGKDETDKGLGDLGIGFFYEALTNYTYTEWTPRIFTGLKLIVPFGENNFNSKKELRTDIRGTGFYKIDLPVVFAKDAWKASFSPQYLPKQKNLNASYAFSSAATYTFSLFPDVDLSSTVQWNYLAKKTYQTTSLVAGQYWEVSVAPAWVISPEILVSLNYTDSTILGKSRNSALYRSISLGITWSEVL